MGQHVHLVVKKCTQYACVESLLHIKLLFLTKVKTLYSTCHATLHIVP